MPEIHLESAPRTEFGKGAARRIRRDHQVPAVVYGHGSDPVHIALPGHALMRALRSANVLLGLTLDGADHLVLPKAVQRDPLRGTIEHVDLVLVRQGEKVTVEVPLLVHGEVDPAGVLDQQLTTLSVLAEATSIPERIELSVEGFQIGRQVHTADIELPEGTILASAPDLLVLHVLAAPTAADLEAELESAEAAAGIERDEPDAAAEAPAEGASDADAAAEG